MRLMERLKLKVQRALIGSHAKALMDSIEQDTDDWSLTINDSAFVVIRHKSGLHTVGLRDGMGGFTSWSFFSPNLPNAPIRMGGLFGELYVNSRMSKICLWYLCGQFSNRAV